MTCRKQTWYNRIFCAVGWHWPKKHVPGGKKCDRCEKFLKGKR